MTENTLFTSGKLNPSCPNPGRREKNQRKVFTLLFGTSKGFMKALKAFIKPFEELQRSVKTKISVNFYFKINLLNGLEGKL